MRNTDVITGRDISVEKLYTIRDFPVNMLGKVDGDAKDDPVFDMEFGISPDSGIIQLMELVPKEMIYVDTHSNAIGKTWAGQHEMLVKLIGEIGPKRILEIGGATGVLERTYRLDGYTYEKWWIIDPEPNPIETNAEFIKGYFPEDLPAELSPDIIVHSHVWEHAYSPRSFIESITQHVKYNEKMVFSLPNLRFLLENKMTSILNFEHTVYLADYYVEYLLGINGFTIDKKEYYGNHSVMYTVVRNGVVNEADLNGYYIKNKSLFNEYIDSHLKRVARVNEQLKGLKSGAYLFGGHIASQFYLKFGLDYKRIIGCLDNDEFKSGKRLGGTNLIIEKPEVIRDVQAPVVVMPSGPYTKEIANQLYLLNKEALLIEI